MTEPNARTVEAPLSDSLPLFRDLAQTREQVVEILRAQQPSIQALGATALYLFGSAARDEMTAESDVDVFIDYEPNGGFTFVEWARLEELLRSCLGRNVDVLTRRSLHPRLKDRIERSSLRIF